MTLEHVAIWTNQLEDLKTFYEKYFDATSNDKYVNPLTQHESYFLTFDCGARLELMQRPDIPQSKNNAIAQFTGIIHLAFALDSVEEVNDKADEFKKAGLNILRGPRITGDGYYEFEMLDIDRNRIEVTTKYN
jgi:lactoylglutathione lyase